MSESEVRALQRALNRFTRGSGLGVAPLIVDGDKGAATNKRIRKVKHWLGFGPKHTGAHAGPEFLAQLKTPRRALKPDRLHRLRVRTGLKRRIARRRDVARNKAKAVITSGVGSYDGKPVARWLIPYLEYARSHGWQGRLNSGWRDPVYSERLCFQMCGAPSCPGRCAGRASNHAGSVMPAGAVDVSDYVRFGQLMRQMPLRGAQPRIFNGLGFRDPVHFSGSG